MKFTKQREVDASIPTASMADIAFLLIIFFMVTTVHEVDRTSVNTPESFFTVEAKKGSAVVVCHADEKTGELIYKFSDGEQMSQVISGPNDVYLETSRLMFPFSANPDLGPQFMIKADGSLPFEKVDQLLEQLRRGGASKVLLLTTSKKKQN